MVRKLLLCFSAVILFSCQSDFDEGKIDTQKQISENNLDQVCPGWIRIKFKESFEDIAPQVNTRGVVETGAVDFDALAAQFGATEVRRVFNEGGRFKERRRKAGLHLWYDFYFGDDAPLTRAVRDFSSLDMVDNAHPVYVPVMESIQNFDFQEYYTRAAGSNFNDPGLSSQWHYYNDGTASGSRIGFDIKLFDAWKITTGSREVIVGVLDSGVDYLHEDLKDNIWINQAELNGTPGVDDDGNGYIDDIYGWNFQGNNNELPRDDHGTHVAGTVAAVNNNNIGVCGVAGGSGPGNNDGVWILNCASTGMLGGPTQPYADAFAYAADMGAVITCNSWSVPEHDGAIKDAIDYFITYAGTDPDTGAQTGPMKGGLVIAAAGNHTTTAKRYPAAYDNVMAVVNIENNGRKNSQSCYGDWVNICAPGGSPAAVGGGVYSCLPNDTYGWNGGTSMACPHVSGIAALIVSHYGGSSKPGLTPDRVWDILIASCRDIDFRNPGYEGLLGAGMVDAGLCLVSDPGVVPNRVTNFKAVWGERMVLTWETPADGNGHCPTEIDLFWSLSPLESLTLDPNNVPEGVSYEKIINYVNVGDTYRHIGSDFNTEETLYLAIRTKDHWGNISAFTYIESEDEDPDPGPGPGPGPDPEPGDNTAPKVSKTFDDQYFGTMGQGGNRTFNLNEYFTDADEDDVLTFTIENTSSNTTSMTASINDGTGVLTLEPLKYGLVEYKITATDEEGLSASQNFSVMVRDDRRSLDVFPSPFVDVVTVGVNQQISGNCQIDVLNSSGGKVYSTSVTLNAFAPIQLNLGGLPAGSYNVVVRNGNNTFNQYITKR